MESKLRTIDTPFGKYNCVKGDLITQQLIKYGAHCRNELVMLLQYVEKGDVVIDVGANIGTFSIPLAKKVGRYGKVYAFEGNDDAYKILIKNIELNKCSDNIEAICAVVSRRRGNFKKITRQGNLGATKFRLDSSGVGENIKTVALDSWFQNEGINNHINLIKIDAEGMDGDVLLSGNILIREHKPIVYMEICNKDIKKCGGSRQEIQNLLNLYGYHFFRNIGKRHSMKKGFAIGKLPDLKTGGHFFDLLAIHSSSVHYPLYYKSEKYMKYYHDKELIKIPIEGFRFFHQNLMKRLRGVLWN